MTTELKYFSDYKMAIESLVAFAKAQNFKADGDFDELVRLWINQSKKQHEQILENKKSIIQIMKAMIG